MRVGYVAKAKDERTLVDAGVDKLLRWSIEPFVFGHMEPGDVIVVTPGTFDADDEIWDAVAERGGTIEVLG